jgi:hypothetical protein
MCTLLDPCRSTPAVSRFRFLDSARNAIEQSNSEQLDIVLLPPTDGDQNTASDEEGDDDILDQDCLPDEVAGEVELHNDEEPNCGTENSINHQDSKRWRKNENVSLDSHTILPSSKAGEDHCGKDAFEIYQLFFTHEMVTLLSEQTELYAVRDKNIPNFRVDVDEIANFLGLLLISGYHRLPSEDDYWSTSDDMETPIFPKTMSRDRFRTIKRYMHLADNNCLVQSKVAKVLPLLQLLRKQCQQFGIFHEFLSIDESMVPYRGLHSARQFIKNKPVRFGYKVWMLCSANGFPYNFEIYCGKDENRKNPLGSHVINTMLEPVVNTNCHVVFFDNFFTSHKLLTDLTEKNIRACGTVRENRTGHCPLVSNKEIQKKDRGSYDFRSDGTVLCVKWHDNCAVTVASNYYGVTPIQKNRKKSQKIKQEGHKSTLSYQYVQQRNGWCRCM